MPYFHKSAKVSVMNAPNKRPNNSDLLYMVLGIYRKSGCWTSTCYIITICSLGQLPFDMVRKHILKIVYVYVLTD